MRKVSLLNENLAPVITTSRGGVVLLQRARRECGQPSEALVYNRPDGGANLVVLWYDDEGKVIFGTDSLQWADSSVLMRYIENSARVAGVFYDCKITVV